VQTRQRGSFELLSERTLGITGSGRGLSVLLPSERINDDGRGTTDVEKISISRAGLRPTEREGKEGMRAMAAERKNEMLVGR
jgi:hypothetical protein